MTDFGSKSFVALLLLFKAISFFMHVPLKTRAQARRPRPRVATEATPKARARGPKHEAIRSVERALQLLMEISKANKPASFADLQKRMALPKATLHKLLSTLEERDFLRRDEESGRYAIGLAVFEVAAGGSTPNDIRSLVNPVLRKLAGDYDEACSLAILDGGEMVYLDRVDPPAEQMVRLASLVGRRIPAFASAGGTAALASLYDEAILTLFPPALPNAPTRNTVRTREDLQQRLSDAREKGYAIDLEETFIGVRGVGVAISVSGWPTIAISFTIPLQRAPIERLRELAAPLKAAAAEIEAILRRTPAPN
jgi:IclR family transcriptional regulator, acetate operon repressor